MRDSHKGARIHVHAAFTFRWFSSEPVRTLSRICSPRTRSRSQYLLQRWKRLLLCLKVRCRHYSRGGNAVSICVRMRFPSFLWLELLSSGISLSPWSSVNSLCHISQSHAHSPSHTQENLCGDRAGLTNAEGDACVGCRSFPRNERKVELPCCPEYV